MPVRDVGDLHIWFALVTEFLPGQRHVTPVLFTARIGPVSSQDKSNRTSDPGFRHGPDRIYQIRMPIPHADVYRQRCTGLLKALAEAVGLAQSQLGNRRNATEEFVMLRHFLESSWRHVTPAQNVCEKWADIVNTLRATETDQQDGVKGGRMRLGAGHVPG
ncbi:uncharacterized protein METZ01_LOCUS10896 [marine metagenome]|uniref:Uncharacterized protein n=1 Tax=marine metagenome TaxID=408172 RepID=A0A381NTX3_9ZZZZ